MTARPLVFVDTETTGLSQQARPWEIAVIRREPSGAERILVAHATYPLNGLPAGTDPVALDIGGWLTRGVLGSDWTPPGLDHGTDLFVSGAESEIAPVVHEWLADEPVMVGVGIHFDAAILTALFGRYGLKPQPWHYAVVDLKTAAWGYALAARAQTGLPFDPAMLPVKSEQLSRWTGVQPPADEDRHTALGDARWAQRWFDQLTNGPSQMPQDVPGEAGTRTEGFQAVTASDTARTFPLGA